MEYVHENHMTPYRVCRRGVIVRVRNDALARAVPITVTAAMLRLRDFECVLPSAPH